MKWKRIRKPICERLQPPGVEDVVKSNDSSQQMTTRHTGCRFARHLENIPQVSVKGGGGGVEYVVESTSGMTDRHLL